MNRCSEYQQLLLEHLYDVLEPDEQHRLQEHLVECLECRSALERARQEQAWLREAARWSFPGITFEAPLAEVANREFRDSNKAAGSFLTAFLSENLPLWALAASLLIAVGLAAWWAIFVTDGASHWAVYQPTAPSAAPRISSEAPRSSGLGSGEVLEERGQGVRRGAVLEGASVDGRQKELPSQATEALPTRQAGVQPSLCGEKPDRAAEGRLATASNEVGSAKPSVGSGTFLNAAESEQTSQPLQGAPPMHLHGATGVLPDAEVGQRLRSGIAPRLELARQAQTGWLTSTLSEFTAFRVNPVWSSDNAWVSVEIIQLGDNNAVGQKEALAQNTTRGTSKGALSLVAPSVPNTPAQQGQGGFSYDNSGNAAVNVFGQKPQQLNTAPDVGTPGPPQVGKVVKESLSQMAAAHQYIARLPQHGLITAKEIASTSIEVPITVGSVSQFASIARIALKEGQYVPALRLQRDPTGQALRIYLVALEAERLVPTAAIQPAIYAQLLDESGQPMGERVAAQARRGVPGGEKATSEFQHQTAAVFYEIVLPLPAQRTRPLWLQLQDLRGHLPTISLLLKAEKQSGAQGLEKPDNRLPMNHQWPSLTPRACTLPEADEYSELPLDCWPERGFDWGTALCCLEQELALQLSFLARDKATSEVERNVYELVRTYLRKHLRERLASLGAEGTGPPSLVSPGFPTARLVESEQVSAFFLGLMPSSKPREAWLVVVPAGLWLALGGFAVACAIFGAVSGRRAYWFWFQRLLGVIVLLQVLWWAWTSVQVQAQQKRVPANSSEPLSTLQKSVTELRP
ncbi:MAG: hypothetical protein RMI91_13320 [Gemmatales bacterium]|nr:zf-HC2 domain-containing protein [Gemmatales bacterium]MDW7995625.1 hypothetical protein [Gemmatales bacterium]